ncbi:MULTISPECIES: hypothetical protein [Neobacillus]|uniref:DUF3888 domain-containing protein n=1 Tax=Neobacillus citreus TaxID=2833578 RepID=A0A942SWX5_9BACI|nr:hypothetical protein [Neobacillus citreus]MCH6265884.1 hypothetical protein [Neobacillus citreus]
MKNILMLAFMFFFLTIPSVVQGEEYNKKSLQDDLYNVTNDVTQEQHLKHFLLNLINKEIILATREYYKDQNISGMAFDWEKNYNVVEVTEPQVTGENTEYPFIVKVNVIPANEKPLGTDTLTFGIIVDSHPDKPENPSIISKLLKYEHKDLPKE